MIFEGHCIKALHMSYQTSFKKVKRKIRKNMPSENWENCFKKILWPPSPFVGFCLLCIVTFPCDSPRGAKEVPGEQGCLPPWHQYPEKMCIKKCTSLPLQNFCKIFLRCKKCIKTLFLNYQIPLYNDFHFWLLNSYFQRQNFCLPILFLF